MEASHFSSNPYFWPSIPTVSGQIENTMFINKMKDQLLPEKGCGLAPPHSGLSEMDDPYVLAPDDDDDDYQKDGKTCWCRMRSLTF